MMKTCFSKTMMSKLSLILALYLPVLNLSAHNVHDHFFSEHSNKQTRLSFFTSHESNNQDSISGVGTGVTFINPKSKLGVQLNTAINTAHVLTTDGIEEDYFAWEGGMKFGLFSQITLYAEIGIDLTELLFHDSRYDHDDYYHEYEDDIDAYIGLGAGFQSGPFKIEGFSRLREIDSLYWQAQSNHFTGIQVSIHF